MKFTTFDSAEDLIKAAELSRKVADKSVESWQETLKTGDFFVKFFGELVIYGEVIPVGVSDFEGIPEEEMSDEMRNEYEYERNLYSAPHMKYQRFTHCYSRACPEGELGDTHVSSINAKITKEQFERAQAAHWPSDEDSVLKILGHDMPHGLA